MYTKLLRKKMKGGKSLDSKKWWVFWMAVRSKQIDYQWEQYLTSYEIEYHSMCSFESLHEAYHPRRSNTKSCSDSSIHRNKCLFYLWIHCGRCSCAWVGTCSRHESIYLNTTGLECTPTKSQSWSAKASSLEKRTRKMLNYLWAFEFACFDCRKWTRRSWNSRYQVDNQIDRFVCHICYQRPKGNLIPSQSWTRGCYCDHKYRLYFPLN